MVPLCYRTATVNGLKKPVCILYASFSDVQDANEMRTVEDAEWNENCVAISSWMIKKQK